MRFKSGFDLDDRNGGKCTFCGANARPLDTCDPNGPTERVIDSDIVIDWEGRLSFCETCAKGIAKMIDWVPREVVTLAENDVLKWQEMAEKLDSEWKHSQQIVDLLTTELANTAGRSAHAYASGYDSALEERDEPDYDG